MPPKRKSARTGGVYILSDGRVFTNQQGKGFFGNLWKGIKKVANFVKDNKLVSKGLSAAGQGQAAGIASQLGLGRRKRKTVRRRPQTGGRKPGIIT